MWTGSDYSHDFSNINTNFTLTSEKNYATNGDYSIKVTSSSNGYNDLVLYQGTVQANETYNAIVTIYNPSSTQVSLRLIEVEPNRFNDISIPSSSNIQTISVSRTVTSNSTLRCYLIIREPTAVYVDNVQIAHQ